MKRAIQLITDSAAHGARSEEADLFDDQERAILFQTQPSRRPAHPCSDRSNSRVPHDDPSIDTIGPTFWCEVNSSSRLSAADFIRNSGSARSKGGPPEGSAASGRDPERARDVGPSCLS